jgi:hypothetical protein
MKTNLLSIAATFITALFMSGSGNAQFNNTNQANKTTLVALLEWAYEIKLSDGQQSAIMQKIASGLTNADKSEFDLINKINDCYTIMIKHPNKVMARNYFELLFLSPGNFDANRILVTVYKTVEELRPGITGVRRNTGTPDTQGSTATPFNSIPNSSFQSGIYRGFKYNYYSHRYAVYFTFYPDGRVLYGHPETDGANHHGYYQVKERVVYITYSTGEKVSCSIDADGSVELYGCHYWLFQKLL